MTTTIATAEALAALPAECLLRSERRGDCTCPEFLITFDCGDGEVIFTVVGDGKVWSVTSAEAIQEFGPFTLLHRPDCLSPGAERQWGVRYRDGEVDTYLIDSEEEARSEVAHRNETEAGYVPLARACSRAVGAWRDEPDLPRSDRG